METDADGSQALGQALGVLLKKGRRDCTSGSGGGGCINVMTEKLKKTADLSLWEHMDPVPTVRETAWYQPRPSACVRQLCSLVYL